MAADDLSAPLGQETKRGRGLSTAIKASLPQGIAIALATFLGAFVLWAVIADNPFGGEPMAVVQIAPPGPTAPRVIGGPAAHGAPAMVAPNASGPAESGPGHHDGPPDGPVTIPVPSGLPAPPAPGVADSPANAGNSRTVTIIDGKTGARQEVVIPGSSEPQNTPGTPGMPAHRARRALQMRRRALPPRRRSRMTRSWSKRRRKVLFRKSPPTACARRKPMRSR